MDSKQRHERLMWLDREIEATQRIVDSLQRERRELDIEDMRARYTCECVALGRDVGCWDMRTLGYANRTGLLAVGLISETLCVARDCHKCGGTGIPKTHIRQ